MKPSSIPVNFQTNSEPRPHHRGDDGGRAQGALGAVPAYHQEQAIKAEPAREGSAKIVPIGSKALAFGFI